MAAAVAEARPSDRARAARAFIPSLDQPHTPHTPSRTLRPTVPPCGRRSQRKFLDLGGSAENQGDLRSVVLHKMTLGAQKSTFPIGASLTAQIITQTRRSR